MPNDWTPDRWRFGRVMLVPLVAPLVFACASADLTPSRRFVSEDELERPPVLLVYDFAVSEADVVVDQAGLGAVSDEAPVTEQQALAREVAHVLAETIVAELRERGIKAEHADRRGKPPLHALLLKGEFRSIDEGDQMARTTVGFGAGKTEVTVVMDLFQQTLYGAKLLASADAAASGSRMPGVLVPVGAGATLGRAATSAVMSATMTTIRELKGPLGADLKNIAEAFAERADALYGRRGWR